MAQKLDKKLLTSGNDDKILQAVADQFMDDLKRKKEMFGNLKDGMRTFFGDIVAYDSYKEAMVHSVQQPMSWVLENAVEDAGLDGTDIWGEKWSRGEAGVLIFEIFEEKKYRAVIDKKINDIVGMYSDQLLDILFEIKL